MKLLTQAIRAHLPPLYAQEEVPTPEKVVHVKFFQPWGRWTWWAVEGEPVDENGDSLTGDAREADFKFFGYVQGLEGCDEWGYFVLSELAGVRGPGGLGIERDLYFKPTRLGAISSLAGVGA